LIIFPEEVLYFPLSSYVLDVHKVMIKVRMMLPLLRPSKEKFRKRLAEHLKSAVCEIRIVNPVAEGIAERLADLFLNLIDANWVEVEKMERFLSRFMEELEN